MRCRSVASIVALILIVPLATGGLGCQRLRDRIDKVREREPAVDTKAGVKANAERLARELAQARTIGEARPAALEALALAGLRVMKGKKPVVQPVAPLVPLRIPSVVADNLALDHVDRQGFNLVQIGTMMADHPLAGPELAFLRDGKALLQVLRKSAARARNTPNDPRSFVPIYISNSISARLRTHISASTARPEEVTLTNFDLLLFATAHRRGVASRVKQSPPPKRASLHDLLVPPAHAQKGKGGPCAWIEEEFGDEMGEMVKAEGQTLGGGAMEAGWESVVDKIEAKAGEAAGKAAGKAGLVLSWLAALVSAIGMYGGYSITIEPDPATTHMCHRDGDRANGEYIYPYKKVHFKAKVSSRPIADERLQKCLDLIGVELPDKDSAKNCTVRWSAGPMFDKFGEFDKEGMDGPGGGRLEQRVDGNGEAKVRITVKEEEKDAKKKGKQTRGSLMVNGELFTQNPNGAKIATMIATGGIPDAVKNWIDRAFPKKAQGTMPVDYHTIKKMYCEKTFSQGGMNYTLKATPKDGLYGPWDGTLNGTLSQHGITGKFEATMSFTIPENGSGEVTGTHSYKSSFKKIVLTTDLVINGQLKGKASIGGAEGAPTLVLRVGGMNTKLAATGRGIQGERLNYQKSDNSGGGEAEFVCELKEK
jgi:hypothetical protein